jgi:hypothetical protein
MCAVFLAVIEGVGIGFQRMMADNTKLEVSLQLRGFLFLGLTSYFSSFLRLPKIRPLPKRLKHLTLPFETYDFPRSAVCP